MFALYCRVYQFIMRIAAVFMPWRKPILIEGEGCVTELSDYIAESGIKCVLLVTGEGIMKRGTADSLLKALGISGVNAAVYDKTVPNPTITNIEEAFAMYKVNKCKAIIALGGGSPIDCAKGVGARVARPNKRISQMRGYLKVRAKLPPIYAIPTTAGTGSEATLAAVVVDASTHQKYSISDFPLIPSVAVLDPLLTVTLPPGITAATGMDALTHAVESYIGRSNTRETREMALKAAKLIFENIFAAYSDGANITARRNMQLAAYYAGIAFTRAYVGNVHALAHTLGGLYDTPHGFANAVIMPHVLDSYGSSAYKPLAELADYVGIADVADALTGDADAPASDRDALTGVSYEQKAKAFIKAIRELNASMEIPETVDFILEKDITFMVEHAFKEANPAYPVPRIFSRNDFYCVIRELMGNG